MEQKWNYFQYRKAYGYPIYLRFLNDELDPKFNHLVKEMGFQELLPAESKKISLVGPQIRVLTIQNASSRLQAQISGSDLLDKYGPESLSYQGGMPIYTYRRVGIMGLPQEKNLWDLALSSDIQHTEHMVGLRIVLVRFLAQSLSGLGVLCYWGTMKDDSIVIMKQSQSFGEAVLIDVNKKVVFFNGGEAKFSSNLKLIRRDKDVKMASSIKREELISFLSVSTCLLSFTGITVEMKKNIFNLSSMTHASYGPGDNATSNL